MSTSVLFRAPRALRPSTEADTTPSLVLQVTLLVLAAALSGFTILWGIQPHDEGLMLAAGSRIAGGQWPYSDFWMNYPPGQPVVLAGLRELLGPSLLVWRVVCTATNAVVALLAYRLARRRAPESYALVAWLAVAGVMAFPALPGPNPPAIALAFGALLAARQRPALAGALAGLAFVFRFEIGVAAALGVAIEALPGTRRRAMAFAAAFALVPLAPFFIAAPGGMLHDTIGFYGIQNLQRLPFPLAFHGAVRPSKLIEFYIPLILVLGLAVWAAAIAARWRSLAPGDVSLVPLAVVGLGYLLGRTDEFHLVPLAAVLPVMLATAAAALAGTALVTAPALRGALLTALALIAVYGLDRRGGQLLHPPALAAVPGPAGDGVEADPADARTLGELERTIGVLTRPGEPIFVANPRFDLVHAGDPLLYVILNHPNPTRYDVMQPGVVTTAAVQREIVGSLQRSHTRVVVRWLDPRATLIESNGAGRSSGVHTLDRYLASAFRPYARYGYYQVLVLKGPL